MPEKARRLLWRCRRISCGSPGLPRGRCAGRRLSSRAYMATSRTHTAVLDLDNVRAHTLPNGLRVRLFPGGRPPVSYYTFFQVGSR